MGFFNDIRMAVKSEDVVRGSKGASTERVKEGNTGVGRAWFIIFKGGEQGVLVGVMPGGGYRDGEEEGNRKGEAKGYTVTALG